MCNYKNFRYVFKGFIFPFSVILTTIIANAIYANNINNYSYNKITAYLDNDLYTDAVPYVDSFMLVFNSIILGFFVIVYWVVYRSIINKEAFYIIMSIYSLLPPILSLFSNSDEIEPLIPANVYLLNDYKYILLDNVKITYLRDNNDAVRIIMADDKFIGYNNELAQGPWLLPFSLSWMSDCVDYFVKQKNIFKIVYIATFVTNIFLVLIYFFMAYQKYNQSKRINAYDPEEKSSMINNKKNEDSFTPVEEIQDAGNLSFPKT
jgi:hypothetical protein